MTSEDHTAQALFHSARVTSVGDRDIIPGIIHALLAVATAIAEKGVPTKPAKKVDFTKFPT